MSSVDTKKEKLSGEKLNFNKITGPDMVVSELSSLTNFARSSSQGDQYSPKNVHYNPAPLNETPLYINDDRVVQYTVLFSVPPLNSLSDDGSERG